MPHQIARYLTTGGELRVYQYTYDRPATHIPREEQRPRGPPCDLKKKSNILKRMAKLSTDDCESLARIDTILTEKGI
jgi:hypothetical protein